LKGRLIDPDGRPLQGITIDAKHRNNPSYTQSVGQAQQTDEQGRFQYKLPVGTSYSLTGHSERFIRIVKDFAVERSQLVDLGDLVVDPDAEDWAVVQAKQAPVVQELAPQRSKQRTDDDVSLRDDSPEVQDGSAAGLRFEGRVTDAKGRAVKGAKIYLLNGGGAKDLANHPPNAESSSSGTFQFDWKPKESGDWSAGNGTLLATVDGLGFGSVKAVICEKTGRLLDSISPTNRMYLEWELQSTVEEASKDIVVRGARTIRGRIVDSEGQPVAGATLKPTHIREGRSGDLNEWLRAAKAARADYYSVRKHLRTVLHGDQISLVVPPARTDKDGWFELKGMARHQIAELIVQGPGIQTTQLNLRGDDSETIRLPSSWDDKSLETHEYFTDGFTYLAGPAQSLAGKLTDHSTGEPISGCLIQAERISTQRIGGRLSVGYIQTRTDEKGEFNLSGLPLGECTVVVVPEADSPYVSLTTKVKANEPGKVTRQDIRLIRGTMVEGTVTDTRTGKPIRGEIQYVMFADNLHVGGDSRYRLSKLRSHYRTDAEGRYRIPALPGPGLVMFMADEHRDYARGGGRDAIEGPWSQPDLLDTRPFFEAPSNYHYVAKVEPKQGTEKLRLPIQLESGSQLRGKVFGPRGGVLKDYLIFGTTVPGGWRQHNRQEFELFGFQPDRPQRLIVWDRNNDATGSLLVRDMTDTALEIRLRPAATLTGQLIDEEGQPMPGVQLINALRVNHSWGQGTEDPQTNGRFPDLSEIKRSLVTDKSGRFRITGLVGGLKYSAKATQPDESGERGMQMFLGTVFEDVIVEEGQTKDLGRVRLKKHRH